MADSQGRPAADHPLAASRQPTPTPAQVWDCVVALRFRTWGTLRMAGLVGAVIALAASVAAAQSSVPRALGTGTGGDGEWSCSSAAHSPTTIRVDAAAGPEGTPGAALEFEYVGDKYNWNWAQVDLGSVDATGCVAVRVTYRTEMPKGFPGLNVMVRESTNAGYWVPRGLPPSPKRFRTETVPLSKFSLPAWSKDENGKLDIDLIRNVSIGVETGAAGKGRVFISDVELVPEGW